MLLARDQSVTLTLNHWGRDAVEEFADPPPQSFSAGQMAYDPATRRFFHGNSNSSSHELHAAKLQPTGLSRAAGTGMYGTADKGGGTTVLAHGGGRLYFGKLQVEASDIKRNTNLFAKEIVAATRDVAFAADGEYYASATAKSLGKLPFAPGAVAVDPSGTAVWAYDPQADLVVKFTVGAK